MYILLGFPPMAFVFTKQLNEITGKKNVTGIDIFADMDEAQRHIAEGLWYVDNNANGNEQFAKDLVALKGMNTQSCAGNAAAGLQVLINAFENAPLEKGELIPNSDSIAKYIRDTREFDTASDRIKLQGDGNFNVEPKIMIVKSGKRTTVGE